MTGRATSNRVAHTWSRYWPLHVWALLGLLAHGWFSVEWILLWEVGGILTILRDDVVRP